MDNQRSPSSRAIALLLVALGLVGQPASTASAFGVQPLHVEMTSAGRLGRAQVTVVNDGQAPLPIEVSVKRITLNEAGVRDEGRPTDDFLIFPPQAMIPPGASQVFRLQWVGEPNLDRSRSFMMHFTQIPVRMAKGKSGVQLAMAMGVLVNVAPPVGEPALRLVGTGVTAEKGRRHPVVTVENPTNVHALLPDGRVRLSAGSWSQTVELAELANRIGIGLVEPGKRRRFVLPVELPAGVQQVQAVIEYRPARR